MALFSRKNIKSNPYGLTEDDLKGLLKYFPMGIVVRMWEETKKQDKSYTIEGFLKYGARWCSSLFDWYETEAGLEFWSVVLKKKDFDLFFERYPEYEKYNL